MKKTIFASTFLFAFSLFLFSAHDRFSPPAASAREDAHADHGHVGKEHEDHNENLDSLFSEDDHAHEEHEGDEHSGHDHGDQEGLAGKPSDPHAGHDHGGHDEHADKPSDPDPHAGHGHGDEHGHGAGDGICPEHNVPEAIDALCQASHVGELQPGQGMKVRLASRDVAAKAGVRTSNPQAVVLADGVNLPVRVVFNRENLAHITPLANGIVRKVHVQPGATVEKGDVLVELAMPELAAIRSEFVSAKARFEQLEASYLREKDLLERGITSRQEFQQAEAEFRGAQSNVVKYRNQLLSFGLDQKALNTITHMSHSDSVVGLRAPFDGVVTGVQTAMGEAVGSDKSLITIADLDSLWLELAIPESQIHQAEPGAAIQARFAGLPGRVFSGHLFQVGASVDERTRTLTALAEVANPDHRLKVGMFGTVQILNGEAATQLMVPSDAVQSIDGAPYIFVQNEQDLFELRRVETGVKQDNLLAIVAGLHPGENVVSGQGFALKSEVLKARLGASCADH